MLIIAWCPEFASSCCGNLEQLLWHWGIEVWQKYKKCLLAGSLVSHHKWLGECTSWEDQYRVRPCRKTGFRRRSSKKVLAPVQYCPSDLFDFLDHWTLRTSFFSCTNFFAHKPEFLSCILGRPSPPTRGILDNKRWNTFCLCWFCTDCLRADWGKRSGVYVWIVHDLYPPLVLLRIKLDFWVLFSCNMDFLAVFSLQHGFFSTFVQYAFLSTFLKHEFFIAFFLQHGLLVTFFCNMDFVVPFPSAPASAHLFCHWKLPT